MAGAALRLYGSTLTSDQVDPQQAAKFEDEAGRYWDLFYKRNSDRFFKDRHYFDKEWPQLTQGQLTVLEVGCGAGNSVFPLLALNPHLRVYACDFSPRAVELVKAHPEYAGSGRVTAFVCDITQTCGPAALSSQGLSPCVDFCSMVFVLSAVAPHKMRQALRNVAAVLKPGVGRVLFRDYADGDLAQTRLQDSCGVKHIRGNFYARGDGTCCYYFGQEELSQLFASEGFVCEDSFVHARLIENRKSGVKMPRRWIQAVFRFDPTGQQQQQQQPGQQQQLQSPLLVPQPEPETHWRCDQQQQQAQASAEQVQCSAGQGPAAAAVHTTASLRGLTAAMSCADHTWLLPSSLLAGSSSSSSSSSTWCVQLAQALADLVDGQQLQLLGRCVLLAPPGLCLQQEQRQQPGSSALQQPQPDSTALQLQQHMHTLHGNALQMQQWQGACGAPGVCNGGAAAASSSSSSRPDGAQQQGAAAALVALVAVWLGARRVFVCLPDAGDGPAGAYAGTQQVGQDAAAAAAAASAAAAAAAVAFVDAFSAVVALNESSVVVERIRPKRWQLQQPRHAAALQREVLGVLGRVGPVHSSGLVVVAASAADAGAAAAPAAAVAAAAPAAAVAAAAPAAAVAAAAPAAAVAAAAPGLEQQLRCGSSSSGLGAASSPEAQQQLGLMFDSLSTSGCGVELLLYKSKC